MSIHSRLDEYRPGNRYFLQQYRTTKMIGTMTVFTLCVFVLGIPGGAGPLYYSLLGSAAGFLCILIGGYRLLPRHQTLSNWARFLHRHSECWFPYFQYLIRHLFIFIAFTATWIQIVDQGMPASPAQNIAIVLLFAYIPVRTFIREKHLSCETLKWERINEISHFLFVCMLFILIGLTVTNFIIPPNHAFTKEMPLTVIAVWAPIALILLSSFVLMVDRFLKTRRKPSAQTKRP